MASTRPVMRSLFDAVFHRPQMQAVNGYFETFTAYAPSFSTWQGGLYEAELTRSIIESGADHASKLKPEISGSAQQNAARASPRAKPLDDNASVHKARLDDASGQRHGAHRAARRWR